MIARPDNSTQNDKASDPPHIPLSHRGRVFLWLFSIAMTIIAGSAFLFKLIEFFYTATTKGVQAMHSFLMPVMTYLVVAAGFACLFLWALLSGQFRDVEGPKYRMLRMQDEIDRHDGQVIQP